jgi:hypothetical protein
VSGRAPAIPHVLYVITDVTRPCLSVCAPPPSSTTAPRLGSTTTVPPRCSPRRTSTRRSSHRPSTLSITLAAPCPLGATTELRAIGELYTVELHTPTSLHSPKQQRDVALKAHVANIYFKCFGYFLLYVASVSYECCKSRSRWGISCNGYTHMFQVYVLNVSFVSEVCCKCFIWVLQK